jgi:hypothetical protein
LKFIDNYHKLEVYEASMQWMQKKELLKDAIDEEIKRRNKYEHKRKIRI